MDKNLTEAQVTTILKNAPKGTDPNKIVEGLVSRGYILQGLNDQPVATEPQAENGTLKNLGLGALKGVGETSVNTANLLSKGFQKLGVPEGTFITPTQEKVTATKQKLEAQGTAQKIGKGVEQIAEFVVPATKVATVTKGMGIAPKIAGQVASDVGVETLQDGDVDQTAKTSFALSSLPFISSVVGKYSKAGKLAGTIAENLEKTSLRLTPVQKLQVEKDGGDIVKFITEKKLTGSPESRYEKISKLYDDAENTVQNTLKKSGVTYSKDNFVNLVKEMPERYSTAFDNPEVYNQLVKLSDELVKYAENFKGDIPVEKINSIKRAYFKNAFNKAGDQVTNEARLAVGETLYKDVLEAIPELKSINKEYGQIIQAKKLLGKALGRNEIGLVGNIASLFAGGALGGGVGAVAAPIIAEKVAGTGVRSLVGSNMQKLSEYLSTAKPDEAGNLIIPRSVINELFGE